MSKDITEYDLKNGLRLVVKEDHRAPVALFQIWYAVGSSNEPVGLTGISHFLEHMMFRGTKHYSPRHFLETISDLGGQQNAYTAHDYTTYYEILPVRFLELAIKFEADRLAHLRLQKSDFVKEKQVILAERRMVIEDSPERYLYEHFSAIAYLASPYRHPVIGWPEDINQLTLQDLKAWYNAWYMTNNALIIVAGDVESKKTYQLVKKYFGGLKPKSLSAQKIVEPQPFAASREMTLTYPTHLPLMIIGFNVPVLNKSNDTLEPYAILLLAEILAGSNQAWLPKKLIEEKSLLFSIDYRYSLFSKWNNCLSFFMIMQPNASLVDIKKYFFETLLMLQQDGPDPKELARIKSQMLASQIYESDSMLAKAHEIGSLLIIGLSLKTMSAILNQFEKVTRAEIKKVANQYFKLENMTVARLLPSTEMKP